mmetsp:Transcript_2487/g.7944  ORF Transcript_2487/g.7944 Transcript_2487/m.7944 type:complete len:281 (-) Transcript_2487:1290-2132(-)
MKTRRSIRMFPCLRASSIFYRLRGTFPRFSRNFTVFQSAMCRVPAITAWWHRSLNHWESFVLMIKSPALQTKFAACARSRSPSSLSYYNRSWNLACSFGPLTLSDFCAVRARAPQEAASPATFKLPPRLSSLSLRNGLMASSISCTVVWMTHSLDRRCSTWLSSCLAQHVSGWYTLSQASLKNGTMGISWGSGARNSNRVKMRHLLQGFLGGRTIVQQGWINLLHLPLRILIAFATKGCRTEAHRMRMTNGLAGYVSSQRRTCTHFSLLCVGVRPTKMGL